MEHKINENDVLVGIAASGTTPYVAGALRHARKKGILTGAISCNPGSPVAAEAEIKIEPVVGPEYVTGSTRMKSGTAQKMVLNMITTGTMIKLGRVKGNRMVNMQLTNQKLVDRGTRIIVDELGLSYGQAKNLLLLHGSVKKQLTAIKISKTVIRMAIIVHTDNPHLLLDKIYEAIDSRKADKWILTTDGRLTYGSLLWKNEAFFSNQRYGLMTTSCALGCIKGKIGGTSLLSSTQHFMQK